MENEEDPNIKLLESLNFQEVKIKQINSFLHAEKESEFNTLRINTTVEEIPTSNNIIIDIEKYFTIYTKALFNNETIQKDYEETEHETIIYFYIAIEKGESVNYNVYLKNINSLKDKGLSQVSIFFNKFNLPTNKNTFSLLFILCFLFIYLLAFLKSSNFFMLVALFITSGYFLQ